LDHPCCGSWGKCPRRKGPFVTVKPERYGQKKGRVKKKQRPQAVDERPKGPWAPAMTGAVVTRKQLGDTGGK